MKPIRTGAIVLAAIIATSATAHAQGAIKPGRWEFTSQLEMPAMPQLPSGVSLPAGVQPQAGGGMTAKHTTCIDPDRAVPTDPRRECKIDGMSRNGGTISWSTICTTQQGAVRSEGVAHYHGDTMEGSMTTHLPAANGRSMDNTQNISGRYLGPCTQ